MPTVYILCDKHEEHTAYSEHEGEYECSGALMHVYSMCGVCVCVLVWEREMERDRVCVHVRVEAERDCQHRVELMCQMSEESVRVVAPSGGRRVSGRPSCSV